MPENAVKFNEHSFKKRFGRSIFAGLIGLIPIAALAWLTAYITDSEINLGISDWGFGLIPTVLFFVLIIISILLYGLLSSLVYYGNNSYIEIYFYIEWFSLVFHCTKAIPKIRFILASFYPTVLFVLLPMILWVMLPYNLYFSNFLLASTFIYSIASGDNYLKIFRAIRQMPKGSMHQYSNGFDSYWFL